ncbi:MAG: hypothetical protein ACQEQE_10825 [Bacillota bacterium]
MENEIERFRQLSREKTYEQRNLKNERTYGTNEKLHQRSNGQGYNKENELRKGTSRHQKNINGNTKQNDFDFEKARKYVKSERNTTKKDFGKWNDRLKKEHEQGLDGNAIDRERTLKGNRKLEQSKQRKLKLDREKNFGFSR